MPETILSESQIRAQMQRIDMMTQMEMARLWRFAPSGHPYFDTRLPLFDYFNKRFKALGGFTPEISKALGW